MVVTREQFEGQAKTYGPGALGCNKPGTPENTPEFTWAQMSYMPDDMKGKMPTWVEYEWVIMTDEYKQWSAAEGRKPAREQYSAASTAEWKSRWASLPHFAQRIELRNIVTPELVAQVRANRKTTQLKITLIFEGDHVSARAEAYKWR